MKKQQQIIQCKCCQKPWSTAEEPATIAGPGFSCPAPSPATMPPPWLQWEPAIIAYRGCQASKSPRWVPWSAGSLSTCPGPSLAKGPCSVEWGHWPSEPARIRDRKQGLGGYLSSQISWVLLCFSLSWPPYTPFPAHCPLSSSLPASICPECSEQA